MPQDPARLEQAVQRLAATARLAGLGVAAGLMEALQSGILAQRLTPVRED